MPVYVVASGAELAANWVVVGVLTLAVVVGTLIGLPVLKRLPEVAFRRFVAILLVVLGGSLLASVLLEAW